MVGEKKEEISLPATNAQQLERCATSVCLFSVLRDFDVIYLTIGFGYTRLVGKKCFNWNPIRFKHIKNSNEEQK